MKTARNLNYGESNGHVVRDSGDGRTDESSPLVSVHGVHQHTVYHEEVDIRSCMEFIRSETEKDPERDLSVLSFKEQMDPWHPSWSIRCGKVDAERCDMGAPAVLKEMTYPAYREFIRLYTMYLLRLLYSTYQCYYPLSKCIHPSIRDELAKEAFGKRYVEVAEADWVRYFCRVEDLRISEVAVLRVLNTLLPRVSRFQYEVVNSKCPKELDYRWDVEAGVEAELLDEVFEAEEYNITSV